MVNCVLLLCCSRVVHLRSLVIVGFDASDEERLTGRQSLHEGFFVMLSKQDKSENSAFSVNITHTEEFIAPIDYNYHQH